MGELRKIPGVGKQTEQDLIRLGYPTIASLEGAIPEEMYERDCGERGVAIDRCQLYVYRCAVYFASTPNPEPEIEKGVHAGPEALWGKEAMAERVNFCPDRGKTNRAQPIATRWNWKD